MVRAYAIQDPMDSAMVLHGTKLTLACGLLCWPLLAWPAWEMSSSIDEMTSEKAHIATTTSTNKVEFSSPQGGPQSAVLSLGMHPRYGHGVVLSVHKAQFLCEMGDCNVLVRFDDEKAMEYEARELADHSNNTLLIHDYDTFVLNLVKAKRVKIEALFVQEGPRIFTFDVAKLPTIFAEGSVKAQREERQKEIEYWTVRIRAKIEWRVVVPPNMQGNPEARFEVVLLPGGEVLSATLRKSSGVPAYDAAVERAIMAAQPLPVPSERNLFQENFRELHLKFRPKD